MPDSDFWLHILYLSFFSLWGVTTRIFVNLVFSSTSGVNADITTSSGNLSSGNGVTPVFNDLPSNILGCFFFGIAVPAATIGLASGASIAMMDANHPFQTNKYIQTGFRTGYCGSVTTFATWNTGMVSRFFTKGQWVMALWGYFLGLGMSVFGLHVGRMVPLFWQKEKKRRTATHVSFNFDNNAPRGIDRDTRATSFSMKPLGSSTTLAEPLLDASGVDAMDVDNHHLSDTADLVPDTAYNEASEADRTLKSTTTKVFLLTVVLVIGLVVAAVLDRQNNGSTTILQFSRQGLWISILFGPPGACLRWWLGKHLNGSVDNFFFGTWVANLLASVLDAIIFAVAFRRGLSPTASLWLFSITNGFNGSLSTVSTWLNEVPCVLLHVERSTNGSMHRGSVPFSQPYCQVVHFLLSPKTLAIKHHKRDLQENSLSLGAPSRHKHRR
eukprot:m.297464 g.297464  ORF g.297464 m.297464 type:complete len:441 (-) comp20081_c0_seq5:444-1766(-)